MASTESIVRKKHVYFGNFVHSKSLSELEYLRNTAIFVDACGKIVSIEKNCSLQDDNHEAVIETLCDKFGWNSEETNITAVRGDHEFFFPGFIDSHVHAPQYPNVGIFGKSTLLDWLNKYTYPMEASLTDLDKASRVYTRCVRRTLAHGTTTAAYYATTDVKATNLLADLCHSMGQRAFIGRVCMDHLGPVDYVDKSVEASLAATQETIKHIQHIDPDFSLISPIITPRFAPSCSSDLMKRLGALHAETKIPLQTHISENVDEVAQVKKDFPDSSSYADVYDKHGLLTEKMILAHAIHLTDAEADLIAARKAKISHCPCSNSSLTSGVARVRWLLNKGIEVGLGTDMSGGYSPSILEAARQARLVSNHLVMPGGILSHLPPKERENQKLSVDEVLYLATRGGAQVVGLSDKIGAFEVGMQWDAQLIELGHIPHEVSKHDYKDRGNVDYFGWESWEDRIAKWVFNGDDRNTMKVWVRGRLVHERK